MKPGDRVELLYCPEHPEAAGSVGTVVAFHQNVAGFGADLVEVDYQARGRTYVMPFSPENLGR